MSGSSQLGESGAYFVQSEVLNMDRPGMAKREHQQGFQIGHLQTLAEASTTTLRG